MKKLIFIVLLIASFYAGTRWEKSKTPKEPELVAKATFSPTKSDKPQLELFVMSFCPYGNIAENITKPVYDLIGNKTEIVLRYIFDKIAEELPVFCTNRYQAYYQQIDPKNCQNYVDQKQVESIEKCQQLMAQQKKSLDEEVKNCQNENNYLTSNKTRYSSMHGKQELNQGIREICAWNNTDDKKKWWDFVLKVNTNCTDQNADTCWEDNAKAANLDSTKITECFNKEAISIIENQLSLVEKYQAYSSPSFIINGTAFPPESAWTNDNTGTVKIGTKVYKQSEYRSPNVIKEAICAAFNKAPKECATVLAENSTSVPEGGCN